MRDIDVRLTLRESVRALHADEPDTLILDEMGLYGGMVRVDLAAINGLMHGYEIKSDKDTLERLPRQVEVYSEVLDRATLVVGERLYAKAKAMVPDWWGVSIACPIAPGRVALRTDRAGDENPGVDPFAVASLLWRDEALQLLEDAGAAKGFKSKPRPALYRRLAETLPIGELRDLVRQTLKSREGWRSAAPRT